MTSTPPTEDEAKHIGPAGAQLSSGRPPRLSVPRMADLWRRGGALVPLLLIAVTFGSMDGRFLSRANLASIVELNSIILVAAVGATFVVLLGSIDLSIEGVMATCAVAVALLVANDVNGNALGWPGVLIALSLGALFGLANGLLHAVVRLPSFVVTLGTSSIGAGIGLALLFSFTLGGNPNVSDSGFIGLGLMDKGRFSSLTLIALGVVALSWLVLRFTRLGRRVYAIGGDERAAALAGVSVRRVKVAVFAIAGTLSGLAGIMTAARLQTGTVDVAQGTLFTAITAVVIGGTPLSGGRGGVVNTAIGVLTLGALNNGLILVGVSPYWQQAAQGAIIVVVLVAGAWPHRQMLRVVK